MNVHRIEACWPCAGRNGCWPDFVAGCQSAGHAAAREYRATRPRARNMRLVGHNDLQARTRLPAGDSPAGRPLDRVHRAPRRRAGQSAHRRQGEQRHLDRRRDRSRGSPKYLAHIPGDAGRGRERAARRWCRLCNGTDLPKGDRAKVYMLRTFGNSAHEMWDVTVPEKPALLTTIVEGPERTRTRTGGSATPASPTSSRACRTGASRRMTQVYDLSDPAKPVHIRDFGLAGQRARRNGRRCRSTLHGPISTGPKGNRIYFGYGTNRDGVLQIVDREKLLKGPKEPTPREPALSAGLAARPAGRSTARTRRCRCSAWTMPEFAQGRAAARRATSCSS